MDNPIKPKNAVSLVLQLDAYSDEDLITRLKELITDFTVYGVRNSISSHTGIVEIGRRDITKEQYRQELEDYLHEIRRT